MIAAFLTPEIVSVCRPALPLPASPFPPAAPPDAPRAVSARSRLKPPAALKAAAMRREQPFRPPAAALSCGGVKIQRPQSPQPPRRRRSPRKFSPASPQTDLSAGPAVPAPVSPRREAQARLSASIRTETPPPPVDRRGCDRSLRPPRQRRESLSASPPSAAPQCAWRLPNAMYDPPARKAITASQFPAVGACA